MQRFIINLSLLFICLTIPYDAGSTGASSNGSRKHQPRFYPFEGGESAQYEAGWNGIPVATAKIRTRPIWVEGEKLYEVKIKAKTWIALDLIWKMRDSIESVFDAKTFMPHHYVFNQKENGRRSETRASYDRKNQKWLVRKTKGKKIKEREIVWPYSFDPVSASYLLRSLDIEIEDRFEINLFGGNNRYLLTIHIAGQEKIELNSGKFDAYRINAALIKQVSPGDDGKASEVKAREGIIWISSDPKRFLLKATSKLWFGSVYLELIGDPVQPGS